MRTEKTGPCDRKALFFVEEFVMTTKRFRVSISRATYYSAMSKALAQNSLLPLIFLASIELYCTTSK